MLLGLDEGEVQPASASARPAQMNSARAQVCRTVRTFRQVILAVASIGSQHGEKTEYYRRCGARELRSTEGRT